MKRIFSIFIAVLLLFAFSAQAAEVYAPGKTHSGQIGKSTRIWEKGYFDYLYLYGGGSSAGAVITDTSTSTLTNKTLTSPTINTPTITEPSFTVGTTAKQFNDASEGWEMSTAEAKTTFLSLTSGSGTSSIIAPASAGKIYIIRNGNATAAGFTATLKVSGATGVSVASGKTAVVIGTATDFVRVSADATH
jgi:hypothetical protein